MSDRKVDINLTDKTDAQLLADEILRKRELKAKLVTVLDRGIVGDRLHVSLPAEVYGEWVSNDKMEIYRMESMGFQVDRKYASDRALHTDGSNGTSIVGDAIFMTCPREVKDLIEEIKRENYDAANKPNSRGQQKEERDFAAEAANVGLPSEMKSRVEGANAESIRSALTATS